MFRLMVISCIALSFLTGCSYQSNRGDNIIQSGNISSEIISDNNKSDSIGSQLGEQAPNQSGLVVYTRISTTGTIEAQEGTEFAQKLQNYPGCIIDNGGIAEQERIYCESISGYIHSYEVPGLHLTYSILGNDVYSYEAFLSESGSFALIVSGNILYQPREEKSYIIKKSKQLHETPEEIMSGMDLGFGCASELLGPNQLFSGNIVYVVPTDMNYDSSSGVRCGQDLPDDGGNIGWYYVFSPVALDYYYIIAMSGERSGNLLPIYTDQSLKLFVE